MPTITTVDTTWTNGVAMDEAELRRADSAMFLGDGSPNGVRGGIVRHGDNSLAVSINGSDQVTVQPGVAVIPAATGLGAYRASLQAATTATAVDPRNATNPRIDLVVFRSTGAVDIITGTPGSSPSAPALPANAIELGRINVPATGGGAATVNHSFRSYATALGGTIYVETAARLPGSGNQKGQEAVALDTQRRYRWNGTVWHIDQGTYAPVVDGLPVSSASATFTRNADLMTVHFRIVASGASTGTIFMSLPANAAMLTADPPQNIVGSCSIYDGGTRYYIGVAVSLAGVGSVSFLPGTDATPAGASVPMTWAPGDAITGFFVYRLAA